MYSVLTAGSRAVHSLPFNRENWLPAFLCRIRFPIERRGASTAHSPSHSIITLFQFANALRDTFKEFEIEVLQQQEYISHRILARSVLLTLQRSFGMLSNTSSRTSQSLWSCIAGRENQSNRLCTLVLGRVSPHNCITMFMAE